jgi:hypothetical protein
MLNEWAKVAWNVFTASIHNPCFLIIRGSAVEKLDFDFEKNRWDASLRRHVMPAVQPISKRSNINPHGSFHHRYSEF